MACSPSANCQLALLVQADDDASSEASLDHMESSDDEHDANLYELADRLGDCGTLGDSFSDEVQDELNFNNVPMIGSTALGKRRRVD